MSNLCLLSSVIRRSAGKVKVAFLCPNKCRARSSLGFSLCISSYVCATAPLLKSGASTFSLSFNFAHDAHFSQYILSLAKAVYFLRFKNFRKFRELYDYLSEVDSPFNSLKDALLLHPRVGFIYFDLSQAISCLNDFIRSERRFPGRLMSYLKSLRKELLGASKLKDYAIPLSLSGESIAGLDSPIGKVLERYQLAAFLIEVISTSEFSEPIYKVNYLEELTRLLPVVWSVSTLIRLKRFGSFSAGHGYISALLASRFRKALRAVKTFFPEVDDCHASPIALLAAFDSIGFMKLLPFLIDDMVEEFFIDSPGTGIYLDHSRWGRCKSNVSTTNIDVKRILTQLRAESSLRLDYSSPSLKTDVITKFFHVRVSVDAPPLTVEGPSLIFRRFRRRPWTIVDLIRNGTISSEAAAYLIFCLFRRRNIIVIGEPATGKTTLINALDILSPPHWRKITIESIVESVGQLDLGKHQVRFRVDPFERLAPMRRKYLEVIRLLHRSPNYLYLGEILTKEHVKALLYALSSGLRGLQTCHASSPESLLVKWVIHYGVPAFCLSDLDTIVLMRRKLTSHVNRRYVARITEPVLTKLDSSLNSVKLIDVFRRNSYFEPLRLVIDLYESPTLQRIRDEDPIDKDSFTRELLFYKKLLELLCSLEITSPKAISRVFLKAFLLSQNGVFDVEEVIDGVSFFECL